MHVAEYRHELSASAKQAVAARTEYLPVEARMASGVGVACSRDRARHGQLGPSRELWRLKKATRAPL